MQKLCLCLEGDLPKWLGSYIQKLFRTQRNSVGNKTKSAGCLQFYFFLKVSSTGSSNSSRLFNISFCGFHAFPWQLFSIVILVKVRGSFCFVRIHCSEFHFYDWTTSNKKWKWILWFRAIPWFRVGSREVEPCNGEWNFKGKMIRCLFLHIFLPNFLMIF